MKKLTAKTSKTWKRDSKRMHDCIANHLMCTWECNPTLTIDLLKRFTKYKDTTKTTFIGNITRNLNNN